MQAIGRQPQRAPDGVSVHRERHRTEQTTLHHLVRQHAATFFAQAEAGAGLPQFVKDEFDGFLECGILTYGLPRLRCGDCSRDKLVAFSCKRLGFCLLWDRMPSCARWWCRKRLRCPPRPRHPQSARRAVRTIVRCG